jgi:diguanylate cyclase (GGDEF)-like protein
LLLAFGIVIVVTGIGLLQVTQIWSPLVLYLLIPVFILVAQRGDQFPVLLLGVVAISIVLLSATWLPAESLAQTDLGILYLDVSLLWIVVFTGMVVSSARQEMHAREQVSWLARHDPLTRLLNRHAFMESLEQALAMKNVNHALLYLDLDRFKDLNDAEGHRAGDQVLRDVSVLLSQEVRGGDTLARLGGDEFAVILADCALLDACAIAENIRGVVQRYEYRGKQGLHRVEVSVGLAELAPDQSSPEDAMHDADSACYEAKRAGRNRIWVYAGGDPASA